MSYLDAHKITGIRPLHDQVVVRDMEFKNRHLASGILLVDDNYKSEGIRPRWGQVYSVGPDQDIYKVGQWILVAHGRWTRGANVEVNGEQFTIRKVDLEQILLVSDAKEKPMDETMGLSGVVTKTM